MIIKCLKCNQYYDDEFRVLDCSHVVFLANDGQNNFKYYHGAWLADHPPNLSSKKGERSEHLIYRDWLERNKVKM
jgi:hypothetical protein